MEINLNRYHKLLKKLYKGEDMSLNEVSEIVDASLSIGTQTAGLMIKKNFSDEDSKLYAFTELSEQILCTLFEASELKKANAADSSDPFDALFMGKAGNC